MSGLFEKVSGWDAMSREWGVVLGDLVREGTRAKSWRNFLRTGAFLIKMKSHCRILKGHDKKLTVVLRKQGGKQEQKAVEFEVVRFLVFSNYRQKDFLIYLM